METHIHFNNNTCTVVGKSGNKTIQVKLENLTENMNELLESSTSTTLLLTLDSIKRNPSIIEIQAQPSAKPNSS